MTTRQHLQRIRRILAEYRDALWHSHANMATGKIDDAGASTALLEYDECIAWLDNTIRAREAQP